MSSNHRPTNHLADRASYIYFFDLKSSLICNYFEAVDELVSSETGHLEHRDIVVREV